MTAGVPQRAQWPRAAARQGPYSMGAGDERGVVAEGDEVHPVRRAW
ncbi:hypothetical protein [Streptomyces sp. TRM68367]|nr:hypothetical protein [Streptomyces sp. TRM68367]